MNYINKQEKDFIKENNNIKIIASYDVIVIGGGIAGISAAIAASRRDCRVLIIEKSIMLGGLATIGFINKYLPLCDGKGKKVCASICEELLHASIKYGYNTLPKEWETGELKTESNKRYMSVFSPYDFVLALDEIIEAEGIDILYDTVFSAPVIKDKKCKAVIVENKNGRSGYLAQYFVDTTGDADLMDRAGVLSEISDNYLSYWGYVTSDEHINKSINSKKIMDAVPLYELGSTADGRGGEKHDTYDGTNTQEITDFVISGRRILRDKILSSTHGSITTIALPHMAQFRTTRRILGDYNLTINDLNKHMESSIGCAPDWRRNGEVYEIPFEALFSSRIDNIITAGRCISAGDDSWEVTRAIPACSVTGEAAGTACSLAIKYKLSFKNLDIKKLQAELEKDGVILHYK